MVSTPFRSDSWGLEAGPSVPNDPSACRSLTRQCRSGTVHLGFKVTLESKVVADLIDILLLQPTYNHDRALRAYKGRTDKLSTCFVTCADVSTSLYEPHVEGSCYFRGRYLHGERRLFANTRGFLPPFVILGTQKILAGWTHHRCCHTVGNLAGRPYQTSLHLPEVNMAPQHTGRNRGPTKGGPSGVRRSYASQLKETESLFNSYEHLQGLPRSDTALDMLRRVASLVKPIMRKRSWKVQILAEFLPPEQNLLGLNINRGYKICIRLRYHNNPDLFLPVEQVVDTMLHELSHNVWGEHDSNFHRLWDELRDEHETLLRKGYTGEGFLSEGQKLGGGRFGAPPPHEMRRLARASAKKRHAQGTLSRGSGQRLGGAPLHLYNNNVRSVIVDQVAQRNTISKGCASGRGDAGKLADQSGRTVFKTKAEEDDANDRAIAQALYELMEQEEERKLKGTFSAAPSDGGLAWTPEGGLYDPAKESRPSPVGKQESHPSEDEQLKWALKESAANTPPSKTPLTSVLSPVSPLLAQSVDLTSSSPPAQTRPHPQSSASRQEYNMVNSKPDLRPAHEESISKRPRILNQAPSSTDPTLGANQSSTNSTPTPLIDLSDPFDPNEWACEICTCINPIQFLACDACGTERPVSSKKPVQRPKTATSNLPKRSLPAPQQKESLGWNCGSCGSFMEHRWWTCSACGTMKEAS